MWEGPSGCAIGVARFSSLSHTWAVTLPEVAPSLLKKISSSLTTWVGSLQLSPVLQADWYLPQIKHCLAAHPMRAEKIPLKRHSYTCPGIPRSHSKGILILAVGLLPIARPLIVPTQEAYWYLRWDCFLYRAPTHCAHSRGILIRAVGLLPESHAHSLCPLKRHTDIWHGTANGLFSRPTLRPTQVAPLSVA